MATLIRRKFTFLVAGRARPIRARDGGGSIGRTPAHFAHVVQFRAGIGKAADDHPVMRKGG